MKELITKASKTSLVIGVVLGGIHLFFSWLVLIILALNEPDAQWQLIWILFLPIDFPFSLVVYFAGSLSLNFSIPWLPYPVSEFSGYILPAIVHGIVGPLWYFFVPIYISNRRRKKKEQQRQASTTTTTP